MRTRVIVSSGAKNIVLLVAAMMAFSGAAHAQSKGVVAAAKQDPISVYKLPSDTEPSGTLAAKGLPWPILEESKEGLLLVTIGGQKVWVDPMDVMANRESSSRCSKGVPILAVGGAPGAANDRCK